MTEKRKNGIALALVNNKGGVGKQRRGAMNTRVLVVGVAASLLPFAGYGVEYNPPIDLGSFGLGEDNASAVSVNNAGQVVGTSGSPQGTLPFLWRADLGMQPSANPVSPYEICGINDKGEIVGWDKEGPFLWREGVLQGLGTVRSTDARAYAVNNMGQAVGQSKGYPVIFEGNTERQMEELLGYQGTAWSINDNGQVVGEYGTGPRAFLVTGGMAKDLGTMGGRKSRAYGVNSRGQVVGGVERDSHHVAFFYDGSEMHDLGSGIAWAINDAGEILGDSATPTNHVVFWTAAQERIELYPAGWESSYAGGINNKGWIVGHGRVPDGRSRAFLLVPVGDEMLSVQMTDTGLSMAWQALEDSPYRLHASNDLQAWVPFGEPVSPVRSIVRFLDPDALGLLHRFYRLELLTP